MLNWMINIIGFSAAILTTFGFVPQFLRIMKTKQTAGLSLHMMIQLALGLLLWLIYGLLREDIVLIVANGVGFLIVFSTLCIYLKYRKE